MRLWKIEVPKAPIAKYYDEVVREYSKHDSVIIEGEILHPETELGAYTLVPEAGISRDHLLLIEHKVSSRSGAHFALMEQDQEEEHKFENHELHDAGVEELLQKPESLRYLEIPLEKLFSKTSSRGLTGLSNLGNTCFMNSALQCLSNTPGLTQYFLLGLWKREINSRNVMGSKGRVSTAYAELMEDMWLGKRERAQPTTLKRAIGDIAPQFRGYNQQDSYDLFNCLIDTVHEDLNRVLDKPYTNIPDSDGREDSVVSKEHWEVFLKRNRSVVVDLFYGQYKSRLICQKCDFVSNTFDPFLALTIPIPAYKIIRLKIIYFPLNMANEGGVKALEISMSAHSSAQDLKDKIKETFNTRNELLLYTINKQNKPSEKIRQREMMSQFTSYTIGAYSYNTEQILREPEHQAKEIYITGLSHFRSTKRFFMFSGEEQVGNGLQILIHKSFSQKDIEVSIFRMVLPLLKLPSSLVKHDLRTRLETNQYDLEDLETAHSVLFVESEYGENNFYKLNLESKFDDRMKCPICKTNHKEHCTFDLNRMKPGATYNEFLETLHDKYDPELRIDWVQTGEYDLSLLDSPEKKKIGSTRKSGTIQLEDCLNAFREEEMLQGDNKWYCGKCKDHVEALKKMDVYRLPNILVIQLKRFIKKESGNSMF